MVNYALTLTDRNKVRYKPDDVLTFNKDVESNS